MPAFHRRPRPFGGRGLLWLSKKWLAPLFRGFHSSLAPTARPGSYARKPLLRKAFCGFDAHVAKSDQSLRGLRPPNPRGFFDKLLNVAAPLSEDEIKKYKSVDDKYAIRGGYITQPLATRSKDDRPNLVYPVYHNGIEIWPDKQWIWEKNRLYAAIEKDEVVFNETKGKWSVRFKQYLRDENGVMRLGKPISILTGPYNQDGTKEIETIFAERIFNNPKPSELIKYLFSLSMMI